MNVVDYLLRESGFLHKNFLLGNKEQLSFADMNCDALRLASFLRETYGERNNILLVSPNSVFFVIAYLAIMKSGNVCVPLNPSIEEENLTYIIKLCEVKIAFVAPALKDSRWDKVEECYYELPNLQHVSNHHSMLPYENDTFEGERLAEIIFTSGSTGEPKGVMLTHRNLIANTDSIIQYLKLTGDDVMEVVLPFYYCYGLSLLHTHMKVGGSVVFNNTFMFLGSVISDLNQYECTGFAGVPSHFQILLRKSKSFKSTEFPNLRYVTQAGGKLHTVFIREFVKSFPEIDFYVMYGQTEATARLSYLSPYLLTEKMGSLGKAIPGVELVLVDEDGHIIEETDRVGELVARGDNIMKGYLGDTAGTEEVLKNGWLHTGDLAYQDADGFFYHTARRKEIIKVGGKRISPKEIEEVIVTMPGVVDCTISAVFDELLGEALKALVIVSDLSDPELDENAIKAFCAQRLAPEKIPRIIQLSNRMEVAATGKKTRNL